MSQDPDEIRNRRAHADDPLAADDTARRRRTTLIIVAVVALLAIVAVALIWRSRAGAAEKPEETPVVVSVKAAKAEKQPIAQQVNALGTVFPRDTAQVSPKISAQIKRMPIWKNRSG